MGRQMTMSSRNARWQPVGSGAHVRPWPGTRLRQLSRPFLTFAKVWFGRGAAVRHVSQQGTHRGTIRPFAPTEALGSLSPPLPFVQASERSIGTSRSRSTIGPFRSNFRRSGNSRAAPRTGLSRLSPPFSRNSAPGADRSSASGAFSRPSTICSLYRTLPSASQAVMSRTNLPYRRRRESCRR